VPKKTKQAEPAAAPIVGPQTQDEWFVTTMKAIQKEGAPLAAREEYQTLLDLYPSIARRHGDLATMARQSMRDRLKAQPVIEEAVKHQSSALRKSLGFEDAVPIERLLIDAVVLCWHDYYLFALLFGQRTGGSFTLSEMERWERILASKEARYLKAIETLARVRRLLKLPSVQINVAAAGGQQVNVAGEVHM
jgi:hypothetical protein